jgi:hypothetical protein
MTKHDQNKRWRQFHIFQAQMETKWRGPMRKALLAQIQQFIDYAAIHTFPFAVAHIDQVITIEPIMKVLKPLYRDAGGRWGMMTYRELNQLKRMSNINSELLDYIDQYFELNILNKSALPITSTLRNWVREQITEGLAEGKSFEQIANDMVGSDFTKNKALVITRTETVRASNAGAIEGARKTGLAMRKVWISAKDNRTRRDHLLADGQTVGFDDSFQVGGFPMKQPGDPNGPAKETINCRCTVGMEAIRDARGRLIRQP